MHRLALLLGIVALIIAVPATHDVFAGGNKVDVCHVNSANQPGIISYDYVYDYVNKTSNYENHYDYTVTYTYTLGKVTSVNENAVPAHEAHGDSTTFYALSEYTADYLQSLEDTYAGYGYENEIDNEYYYYYYSLTYNVSNAVVKNADCYMYSYEYMDN